MDAWADESFDSKLVRLEVNPISPSISMSVLFQFQIGAIRSVLLHYE